jgi:hypothetical protein
MRVMLSEVEPSLNLFDTVTTRDFSTSLEMTESWMTDGIREKHATLWR